LVEGDDFNHKTVYKGEKTRHLNKKRTIDCAFIKKAISLFTVLGYAQNKDSMI